MKTSYQPRSDSPRLSVVGGTGFIGSAVVREAAHSGRWFVRSVSRNGAQSVDTRDRSAIIDHLAGSDAVVHSASYIGSDPELCHTINVVGTTNVTDAVRAHGIRRLVYISTAAVYGRGPFDNLLEDATPLNPASVLSASRAAAESAVLAVGGIVVRPHLVLGAGDRWVGPGIVRLTRAIGGLVDRGTALHSVIDVDTLGATIIALCLAERPGQRVYHAALTRPSRVIEVVEQLRSAGVSRLPTARVPFADAQAMVRGDGQLTTAFALLGTDHVFNTDGVRGESSVDLGAPFQMSDAARRWYRTRLAAR